MAAAGIAPNVVSFSSVMSGYAKQAQPDDCVALLRRMHAEGVRADTVTLNALLEAHARAAQPQQALGWLRRCCRRARRRRAARRRLVHDRDWRPQRLARRRRRRRARGDAGARRARRPPLLQLAHRRVRRAWQGGATHSSSMARRSPRPVDLRPSARGRAGNRQRAARYGRRAKEPTPPPSFCVTSLAAASAPAASPRSSGAASTPRRCPRPGPPERGGAASKLFARWCFFTG